LYLARGTDLIDFAVPEDAQQVDLHLRGQLPGLAQKHRSGIGHFGLSGLVRVSAAEGPAREAEELGLQQLLRNRAAVDCFERPRLPAAVVMNGASQQLFGGTGFAGDQHRGIMRGDTRSHLEHRRSGFDQARVTRIPRSTHNPDRA
jgi:hypothetical protein